jgi:hypothetical protein
MRGRAALALFIATMLANCGSTKSELDALTEGWKSKIATAIPIGTEEATARAWFEKQGLKPHADLKSPRDMVVWLGSVPAREWFCSQWMANVTVRTTPDGRVASYEFGSAGQCL